MSTAVYTQDMHDHLDRKHLLECLEDAISQINRAEDKIVFSFGNVEVHMDYPNDELFIVV